MLRGSLDSLAKLSIRLNGALTDLFQRLLTEDMFSLAGVLGGGLFVHAQLHEEVGEQTMAAVDAFCDLTARLQQGQVAFERTTSSSVRHVLQARCHPRFCMVTWNPVPQLTGAGEQTFKG